MTHCGCRRCCQIGKSASTRRRGVFFKRGEADFFIAWRDGVPVGTICAAEDRQANAERGDHECVFGFFNFIEDYSVMEALLQRATGLGSCTRPGYPDRSL